MAIGDTYLADIISKELATMGLQQEAFGHVARTLFVGFIAVLPIIWLWLNTSAKIRVMILEQQSRSRQKFKIIGDLVGSFISCGCFSAVLTDIVWHSYNNGWLAVFVGGSLGWIWFLVESRFDKKSRGLWVCGISATIAQAMVILIFG